MIKEYPLQLPRLASKGPLKPVEVLTFERFLRLNPHWAILDSTVEGDTFRLRLQDHESEVEFDLNGKFIFSDPTTYEVHFDSGDYSSIIIRPKGDEMIAEVNYNAEKLDEKVETHIVFWLKSIREYLRLFLKNNPYNYFFRVIMNKIILTMTPSQRKISLMLYRITLLELLAILLIVVGYFFFMR